jgi:hypothetical protein
LTVAPASTPLAVTVGSFWLLNASSSGFDTGV